MSGWQLAQLNIALAREPLDSPALAEFMAALEPVNALADAAPGFVWRLQDESGDATSIRAFDDDKMLWWVPAGPTPTVDEAKERLQALRAEGPTPYAFTFKHRFPAPDMPGASRSVIDDREFCPAG